MWRKVSVVVCSLVLVGASAYAGGGADKGKPAAAVGKQIVLDVRSSQPEYMAKEHKKLSKRVYPVPEHIDKEIARLKLESMNVEIDTLTAEQEKYLSSWEMGT